MAPPIPSGAPTAAAPRPTRGRSRTAEIPGQGAPAALAARAVQEGVDAVMTTEFACVSERESISTLRHLLLERRVGGVPVIDPQGRPVGIVTGGDLLRAAYEGGPPPTTADEVMTHMVFALPITASVAQAAALIAYEGVKAIVICDLNGRIAGLVRALDIARWCARGAGYLVDREESVDSEAA